MQERYLGDSHDYVKYALLRHLNDRLNLCIGINWYLTERSIDHPSNNDGEKRHHLNGGVWKQWDPELFERIKVFADPCKRIIETVRTHHILPDSTILFEEVVPAANREAWHKRSLEVLASSDLVFLDPDNGFGVKSASVKKLPKYALYKEAINYYGAGKIVVAIQFARQCNPETKARDVRDRLYKHAGYSQHLPVLRARVAPNILFLFLVPQARLSGFEETLKDFVDKSKCPERKDEHKAKLID